MNLNIRKSRIWRVEYGKMVLSRWLFLCKLNLVMVFLDYLRIELGWVNSINNFVKNEFNKVAYLQNKNYKLTWIITESIFS